VFRRGRLHSLIFSLSFFIEHFNFFACQGISTLDLDLHLYHTPLTFRQRLEEAWPKSPVALLLFFFTESCLLFLRPTFTLFFCLYRSLSIRLPLLLNFHKRPRTEGVECRLLRISALLTLSILPYGLEFVFSPEPPRILSDTFSLSSFQVQFSSFGVDGMVLTGRRFSEARKIDPFSSDRSSISL